MPSSPTLLAAAAEAPAADPPTWLVVLLPVLFLLAFVPLWCGIVWISSRFSGWSRVAAHFRAGGKPEGRHANAFGCVGWGRHSSLQFHLAEEGLFVQMPSIFRFGYAPLFLPWRDLHTPQATFAPLYPCVKLAIGHPRRGALVVPKSFYEQTLLPHLTTASSPPSIPTPESK